MNRIIFIYHPKTGDWIIKNNFTSISEANQFISKSQEFKDYKSYDILAQGEFWNRYRQTVQSVTARKCLEHEKELAIDKAAKIPAVGETVVSKEAKLMAQLQESERTGESFKTSEGVYAVADAAKSNALASLKSKKKG